MDRYGNIDAEFDVESVHKMLDLTSWHDTGEPDSSTKKLVSTNASTLLRVVVTGTVCQDKATTKH